MGISVEDRILRHVGFEQVTGLSSAKSLTVPTGALFALIQASDQDVRWRADTTAPTASIGMLLSTDDPGLWWTAELVEFTDLQFIEVAGGAKLNVTYFK